MTDAFYSLGLTREQLVEVHRALLSRYLVEETFLRERGEESQEPPALLAHLERLLDLGEDEAHVLFHEEEDRLWEYSWYAYTDEWAWYRARQDTEQELGTAAFALLGPEEVEQRIEQTYDDHFDRYTKEIDMASSIDTPTPKKPRSRRAKK